MRLSELVGARVHDESDRRLGAVHEIYAKGGAVEALGVGGANLLEWLLGGRRGRRIAWTKVRRVEGGRIVVED